VKVKAESTVHNSRSQLLDFATSRLSTLNFEL
jgi:hypothetical protein